jgi:hypothetical protein
MMAGMLTQLPLPLLPAQLGQQPRPPKMYLFIS